LNFVDATSLWSFIITYVLFVSWTGAILIGEKLNDDDDDDDDDVVDIDFDNVVVDKGLMHSLTSVYPKFDGDGVVLDVVVVHGDGVEED